MEILDIYKKYPDLELLEKQGQHRVFGRKGVLRLADKCGIGMEFGAFTGVFTEALVRATQPEKLFIVDPWSKLHGSHFPNWGAYTAGVSLPTSIAKEAVEFRASKLDVECHVIEEFGAVWLSQQQPEFLDWVYLDANHEFEQVYSDLVAIHRVLKQHGTIMGDDCWVKTIGHHSDVFWALREFCRDFGYEFLHIDAAAQWAITHTSNMSLD